ncbi:MAG: ABC transporter substrate-binding protein [Desulfobacterales bacterium]|nr:ABC transporter substrate-binding protein [Desulfobacterales bacterium]
MKMVCRMILLTVTVVFFLSFSSGFAADTGQYPTTPGVQPGEKWRIAYYEGGHYPSYPKTLRAIVKELAVIGWTETATFSAQQNEMETDHLWRWLSSNIKSRYLEFVPDAYYSSDWNEAIREKNRHLFLERLKKKNDINLIIAMGTLAGQDLANDEHSVPVIVCGTADAWRSKIITNSKDSGYDHVHAHIDPTKYLKQIQTFHDIFKFGRLGMSFENTTAGKSYAALEDVRKVARERNFKIEECHTTYGYGVSMEQRESSVVKCARKLARKVDAFYLTMQAPVNKNTISEIVSVMNRYKVPVFSQAGSYEVRQGALLSIADSDFSLQGKFQAETIAKVINGAKPRELNQILELPTKIAFNASTAMQISLKDDIYNLLLTTAEEVYKDIEK